MLVCVPAFEKQLLKSLTTDWFDGSETLVPQFVPAKAAVGAAAISSNDSVSVVLTNLVFMIIVLPFHVIQLI